MEHVGRVDDVERSFAKRKTVSVVDLHGPVLFLKSLLGRSRPPFQVDGNDVATRGSEQSSLKPAASANFQDPRAGRDPAFHDGPFLTPDPLEWCVHKPNILSYLYHVNLPTQTARREQASRLSDPPRHPVLVSLGRL